MVELPGATMPTMRLSYRIENEPNEGTLARLGRSLTKLYVRRASARVENNGTRHSCIHENGQKMNECRRETKNVYC